MTDWQAMKNAPRDGTVIIAQRNTHSPEVAIQWVQASRRIAVTIDGTPFVPPVTGDWVVAGTDRLFSPIRWKVKEPDPSEMPDTAFARRA